MKDGQGIYQKKDSYYSRLWKLHSLAFVLLALIPLFFVSWSSSHYYQRSCLLNTQSTLQRAVENRKEIIALFLNDKKNLLWQIMRLYPYETLKNQEKLEGIFVATARDVIVDIGIINVLGQQIAYVGPYQRELVGKTYERTEWFKEAMIRGVYVSDIFLGFRQVPHIVVAVTDPLKKYVLRITLNSELFNDLLRSVQGGESGDAYIVNRKGELQTPSRFGLQALPEEEKILLEYHEGSRVEVINNFLYITSWLKDGEWLLLVKVQKKSILETFHTARTRDIITILIASIIIITAASLTMRHMVGLIEAADRKRTDFDNQMRQVEQMASLGRLAAGVAHEVNNPLQMITDQAGWIDELMDEERREDVKNLEEYRKAVVKIKYHVKRASTVTHRLLGFSRKMETEKNSVSINDILDEAISFLEKEAENNGIEIRKHYQQDIPAIVTDAPRIQQVVLNLLNNSMDAIDKNGFIDVTTRVVGDAVAIDIQDDGPGIKQDIMDKIFDPFFTTKAQGKGTGLGLSLCYNIIMKLGGNIEVRNNEEGGAVFTVILPIIKLGDRME
ncbi:MAG: ATP-binding protein [Desulfobulbaceae bacterium]|nr:ATP-binding protein [Desulfobulbaceae bacterium]